MNPSERNSHRLQVPEEIKSKRRDQRTSVQSQLIT